MEPKTHRNILLVLLMFLGVGAIFGGGVLMISPSGRLFGMPLTMLSNSPFNNFFIPGFTLFAILGVCPVVIAIALLRRPENRCAEMLNCYKDMYWAWTYSIYVAFALIIWIQVEMTVLRAVHWSHSLYMGLAVAILFVALLPRVRSLYRKQASAFPNKTLLLLLDVPDLRSSRC
jgi:hypothetical protein